MKYYAQDSIDGKKWRQVSMVGMDLKFNNRVHAKEWFDKLCDSNSVDERTGNVARFSDGRWYRIVDKFNLVMDYTG